MFMVAKGAGGEEVIREKFTADGRLIWGQFAPRGQVFQFYLSSNIPYIYRHITFMPVSSIRIILQFRHSFYLLRRDSKPL